ncbi:SEC-C domain-containing protein [Sphingomonas alpina]|uniref:SEC-C domain-containing protein n=1 Tax=Sphingomonas alpina TaxID=653931 RepID=A0A7H0LQG9_9SPHN|nr:SEC-C domain-containing protein [Sphingomonas alpina]
MAPTCPAFEITSKRRKGFPSETNVKRGVRIVNGDKYLIEKLGRNDPCPCGSGHRFQALLPRYGAVSMEPGAMIIGASR